MAGCLVQWSSFLHNWIISFLFSLLPSLFSPLQCGSMTAYQRKDSTIWSLTCKCHTHMNVHSHVAQEKYCRNLTDANQMSCQRHHGRLDVVCLPPLCSICAQSSHILIMFTHRLQTLHSRYMRSRCMNASLTKYDKVQIGCIASRMIIYNLSLSNWEMMLTQMAGKCLYSLICSAPICCFFLCSSVHYKLLIKYHIRMLSLNITLNNLKLKWFIKV